MRLRATVAYDGTNFHGFQRQANARSVQGELEAVLGRICGERVGVTGAGRTDAGVHATGQVIACEANWRHTLTELQNAMNSELPDDVAVREVVECEERFHPRFSARSRTYEYTAFVGKVRQPLMRLYAWRVERELDLAAMNEAAGHLTGEHDFAAFGTAPQGEGTVRNVLQAGWEQVSICPTVMRFRIEANAFLFRMVRRIVMTLARVGDGRLSANDVRDILTSKDSRRVMGTAPACGLCLVKVTF